MATSMATQRRRLLQNCCVTQTVDVRALIDALPPEDEAQQRQAPGRRTGDAGTRCRPQKQAIDLAEPTAVAEPDADLFDLPPLSPDDGM